MSENTASSGTGLLESLTTLAATLVAIAQTRLELLSSDLEEEREHVFSLLASTLVALFCLGVGVVLVAVLIVVAFWDTQRLLALGSLSVFFLAVGVAAGRLAMRRVKTKPRLFATSLSELLKDRQQLGSRP
ncbi:MAG: phage holin family protein [Gallionellaceae bacterium]|nr:phage holin family protein [Gallionellaceae bacterium]